MASVLDPWRVSIPTCMCECVPHVRARMCARMHRLRICMDAYAFVEGLDALMHVCRHAGMCEFFLKKKFRLSMPPRLLSM